MRGMGHAGQIGPYRLPFFLDVDPSVRAARVARGAVVHQRHILVLVQRNLPHHRRAQSTMHSLAQSTMRFERNGPVVCLCSEYGMRMRGMDRWAALEEARRAPVRAAESPGEGLELISIIGIIVVIILHRDVVSILLFRGRGGLDHALAEGLRQGGSAGLPAVRARLPVLVARLARLHTTNQHASRCRKITRRLHDCGRAVEA